MQTDTPNGAGMREHASLRTTCGREVRVGWLATAAGERPARRVSLDMGSHQARTTAHRGAGRHPG
jgi:hypothetical protein